MSRIPGYTDLARIHASSSHSSLDSNVTVDLAFTLTGLKSIPADHGYALYGALSRRLPALHGNSRIGIHSIAGRQIGNRQLSLQPWSRLSFRVPDDQMTELLSLSGQSIEIGGASVCVGVPEVHALQPSTVLRSRLVTIKIAGTNANKVDAEKFATSARKQLDRLEISPQATLQLGKRRTARIKQQEIVGYEVLVAGLLPEESIKLQEVGLGGRRLMGCGVLVGFDR